DPKGPFREKGLVVTSLDNNVRQTNAIDPTVIVDKNGAHWMYYGSAWDGIYKLEIDPSTGLAVRNDDKGVRVAQRAFTNGKVNGNVEGAEIIYNSEFDMYYLFISYDWLQTKYNVRVGRSQSSTGPFYDMFGNDMNQEIDDHPMILAPYKFAGHGGWQGVSHPGVFEKYGKFFIGHQGRPGVNSFYMVMHTRQMFWTPDGWPLVSSQRYATEEETPVEETELVGDWEWILFDYRIVPGYADEQVSADFQVSEMITLDQGGTINGDASSSWSYSAPWLSISYNGTTVQNLRVERGRDWENEVASTVLFTGLGDEGRPVWGKKLE
ncbi:MAG: glycoside hydrolase family 43 protein, partial [Saprospiraceae bacterium]|nr:glycoside hydrolase family 43 protein [Saprospiraceae bacterium]